MAELKTEHSGAKKAKGAFWGHKRDAKKVSKKKRRINGKTEAKREFKAL